MENKVYENLERLQKIWDGLQDSTKTDAWTSFLAGFDACLKIEAMEKALKLKRKSGSLIPEDFLNNDSDFMSHRWFLTGVYHDSGKELVTDGRFLLIHNEKYSEDKEGKIIDKNDKVIEGNYPKWQNVVPDEKNMEVTDAMNLQTVRLACSVSKAKSDSNLVKFSVAFNDTTKFSLSILKRVEKFWTCYPDAVLMKDKEDSTKAWTLTDEKSGDKFVFMPFTKTSSTTHVLDSASMTVTERKE